MRFAELTQRMLAWAAYTLALIAIGQRLPYAVPDADIAPGRSQDGKQPGWESRDRSRSSKACLVAGLCIAMHWTIAGYQQRLYQC
eukprot:3936095-Rhodomonas_salina.5